MARVSVQDCLEKVPNRFALVMLAARRTWQIKKGSDPLVQCNNKEIVTALREIAGGFVRLKKTAPVETQTTETNNAPQNPTTAG